MVMMVVMVMMVAIVMMVMMVAIVMMVPFWLKQSQASSDSFPARSEQRTWNDEVLRGSALRDARLHRPWLTIPRSPEDLDPSTEDLEPSSDAPTECPEAAAASSVAQNDPIFNRSWKLCLKQSKASRVLPQWISAVILKTCPRKAANWTGCADWARRGPRTNGRGPDKEGKSVRKN